MVTIINNVNLGKVIQENPNEYDMYIVTTNTYCTMRNRI